MHFFSLFMKVLLCIMSSVFTFSIHVARKSHLKRPSKFSFRTNKILKIKILCGFDVLKYVTLWSHQDLDTQLSPIHLNKADYAALYLTPFSFYSSPVKYQLGLFVRKATMCVATLIVFLIIHGVLIQPDKQQKNESYYLL